MRDTITLSVTALCKNITTQINKYDKETNQGQDITVYEFLNACRNLAIAIDYDAKSWDDAILHIADEIRNVSSKPVKKRKSTRKQRGTNEQQ